VGVVEPFPYDEFRPFQREIYERTYSGLKSGVHVIINAPTGLGKTAAVLSAVVKYVLETGASAHYVVRTRTELEPPIRELARMAERGVVVDYAVIKSRQDMCCYDQLKRLDYLEFLAECDLLRRMGECEYHPPKDVDVPLHSISAYVRMLCASGSCPYEYARQRIREARLVVSTYYYVFGRERADVKDRVIVIDEAHSLVDSVARLHSIRVSEADVRAAYREARRYGFVEEARKIYALLAFIKRARGVASVDELAGVLGGLEVEGAAWEITKRRIESGVSPFTPLVLVRELRRALKGRARYFIEARAEESGKAIVLYPLEPEAIIRDVLREARAVAHMSGTLPVSLYAETLGVARYERVDIPFNAFVPRSNYLAVVDVGVTTKYGERDEDMYLKIAQRVAAVVNVSPGGVLAVFPSYEVMKGVRRYLRLSIAHWYEDQGVVDWGGLPDRFFVGAVARGRYAEGVEYVRGGRSLLATVVIVGVPYPEPAPYLERRVESLRPRLRGAAWSAVYLYEAVVSVRQAVGRLFRGPRDRGVLAFLDRRYVEPELWQSLSDVLAGSIIVGDMRESLSAIEGFFGRG
jgi:DNA excision repair protein ERCC-2